MMSDSTAYSTSDPDAVAAFLAAKEAQLAFARQIVADAAALGKNKGVLRSSGITGDGYQTIGLEPDDPNDPPEGWVYSKGKRRLVPRRGKAGAEAQRWLDEHQPPKGADPFVALVNHGLLPNDMLGLDGDISRFGRPTYGHINGELWALYRGRPGVWYQFTDGPHEPSEIWARRKLSEYHAARESAEIEQSAGAA